MSFRAHKEFYLNLLYLNFEEQQHYLNDQLSDYHHL
nr:MAG TPA: hypothetical protein [Caudoviricetes sp.]